MNPAAIPRTPVASTWLIHSLLPVIALALCPGVSARADDSQNPRPAQDATPPATAPANVDATEPDPSLEITPPAPAPEEESKDQQELLNPTYDSSQASWKTNNAAFNFVTGPQLGTQAVPTMDPGFVESPFPEGNRRIPPPPIFRWGPITAHPHLMYGLTYGTGLLSGPQRNDSTFINTVSPGITLEMSSRWKLDYTPSIVIYTADGYQNTVNNFASLRGAFTHEAWNFTVFENFSITDSPLVETGTQTKNTVSVTRFDASRALTPRLSLNLGVDQNLRWTGEFNNVMSWIAMNSLNYQLRPFTTIGAAVGAGYDLVEPGTDMTHEVMQLSVHGQVGRKWTYGVSGGFEVRQFLGNNAPMKVSPVANLGATYNVTDTTAFNVFANHRITPSFYTDQFAISSAVGAGITQQIFGRFTASAIGGFRWTQYNSTFNPTKDVQSSDYTYFRIGISSRFLERGSATIYYLWSNNDPTTQAYAYNSQQISLVLRYGF